MVDLALEDLIEDLEPPVKILPLIVEVTTTYLIWEHDDSDLGPKRLAERISSDPIDLEVERRGTQIDCGLKVRPMEWSWEQPEDTYGPWGICPAPGCGRPQYPAYGMDPTCYRHEVRTTVQHRHLPVKEFA